MLSVGRWPPRSEDDEAAVPFFARAVVFLSVVQEMRGNRKGMFSFSIVVVI